MKKIFSSLLLATLVLSVMAFAIPVKAAVVGTLEVSTTQFWMNQIVQIKVYDPDMNINPNAYDTLTVSLYKGDQLIGAIDLNETLPNSGEFIAYLCANDTAGPANPPYGTKYPVYGLQSNFSVSLASGDTIKIVYNDQSPVGTVSQTLTFKEYVPTSSDITFDRSNNEYPMFGYMRIYIKGITYNLDPTTADSWIFNVTFTAIGTTISSQEIPLNFTETGPNTGVFRCEINYTASDAPSSFTATATGFNFTGVPSGTPIEVKFTNISQTPAQYITVKRYTPSIVVDGTFTPAGDLTITVVDPNANLKSWTAETIGDYNAIMGNTNVTIITNKGQDIVVLTADFKEDDTNSGRFKYTVPVTIGTVNDTDNIIQLTVGDTKVNITYYVGGSQKASTVSTWSKQAASLTIDKTMYRTTGKVTMTLVAPDLNTDSNSINFITTSVSANQLMNYSNMAFQIGTQTVGNMTVKVNGLPASASSDITITFIETGVNTGVFTATLDLSNVRRNDGSALANGDSLSITYYDAINNVYSTATATIGVAAASISLDRTSYPVPLDDNVKVYITVTDTEANRASSAIDTTQGYIEVYYYNGTLNSTLTQQITLTETDANTGVFTYTFTLPQSSDPAFINGWVKALYVDPASGKNITATATLVATDASITTDKTEVKAGDTLTITVVDPDNNFDSKAKNSVTIKYEYTAPDGTSKSDTWSLTETDVNTATFTKTITIGSDIKVKPGTTITFTYNDSSPSYITAASGYPSTPVARTATVKVASFTGTLSIDKTEYGLGSKMIITVNDPDLNTDITTKESVTVTLRLGNGTDIPITLVEDGVNSPIFKNDSWKWPIDASLIGTKFMIYYKDEADANGNTVFTSVTGTIKSWDGQVSFEKQYYNIGDIVTVIVKDPDANTDPSKIETVTVKVTSDSDPIGQSVPATETDANTGVFVGRIQIVGAYETGKVYVKYGDTLYAKYTDSYPADYADTGKSKTFTGTAIVGVPVARPVPASAQKFVDPVTGAEVTAGTVGKAIGLQATVKNVDVVSKPFTAVFKVKDAAGVTIYIAWISGTLAPGQELTPGVSWTPDKSGNYTVEVMVFKSLAEPTPFSDVISTTLTVR